MADHTDSSRDLLFGLIALERGHVDQAQLVEAFRAWTEAGSRSMSEVMTKQGAVSAKTKVLIERLVADHFTTQGERATKERSAPGLSATVTHMGRDPVAGENLSITAGTGGRFQVLRPHARGGLGEVFLALDPELNRTVALKELQAQRAFDPASQARFLLEAELTGRLEHPGIVPVYGLGRYADGRPYYAMRFIEGETLRTAIERFYQLDGKASAAGSINRELAFRRLLGSLIGACNAVAYAHSRGVVHRDIKPENIMMGRFGETLLVDWGVAKPLGETTSELAEQPSILGRADEASLTVPGAVMGTPRYMSPEQAAGDLERIGPASDIYNLGATLYCLLVGKPPFADTDMKKVLGQVRRGIFPAPRRLRREVDPTLEAICLKAMSVRPEERHGSALELAQELEAWLADIRYREEQERALNQMKGSLARLCLERAYSLLGREMQAEGMLWLARALEHAPPELEPAVRSGLSGWHVGGKLMERMLRHNGPVHALVFGPDGRRLATAGQDGTARLWDVATGAPLFAPLAHEGPVRAVAFHPNGERLVSASEDGTIQQWDLLTGERAGATIVLGSPVVEACYSPDGSTLAVICDAGGAFLWKAATGKPVSASRKRIPPLRACVFSPDGMMLATSTRDGGVSLWDASTARALRKPLVHGEGVSILAFSPDGRMLLTAGEGGKARLWDVAQRELVVTLDHRSPLCSIAFAPGGAVIATAGTDATARIWDVFNGRPIGESLTHQARIDCLAFSPDGSTLATGSQDGAVRLWDSNTGLPIAPPLTHRGPVVTLAFTVDGRRLATGSGDGFARFWKVPAPLEGDVERVACWVRVTTDLEFDEGDAIRRMEGATSWALRRRLVELGGPPIR